MHNYTDLELKKELRSRGYEVFNKDYATEYLWTLDDAIDSYDGIRESYKIQDELTHEQLMRILNDTITSSVVMSTISELLYENIRQHLIED
jgi:hypothetical protein